MATFTQQMLDSLIGAIAQGALEVWYGDKRVKYRSLDEMLKIKTLMEKDLGLAPKDGGRRYAKYNKGFGPDTGPDNNFIC